MDKFIVKKVEVLPTKAGGTYKRVDLQKNDGSIVTGVSAFSFKFPALDLLVEGGEILGSIVIDGNYKNLVGVIEKPKGNSNFRTQQMEKVMDKKADTIKEFQENKNDHIILSATFRDATLLTVAQVNQQGVQSEQEIEEIWKRWRIWLANQFGDKLSDIQQPF